MNPKFLNYLETRFGSTQKGIDFLQFAGWLVCLGITLPVMSSVLVSPVIALINGMLFFLGVIWLAVIRKKGLAIISSPIDGGMVAIFLAVLVTTAFSIDPSRGMRTMWQWFALIVLFYIVLTLFRLGFSFYPLMKALLVTASIFLLFAYLDFFIWIAELYAKQEWPMAIPETLPRVSGLIENPNPLAGLLSLIFASAMIIFIEFKQHRTIWLTGWLAITTIILIITQSRGVWAGLLLAFSVYGLGKVWYQTRRNFFSSKALRIVLLGISAGIFVLLFLLFVLRSGTFLTISSIFTGRLDLWTTAIDSWFTHPWFGRGLNSYPTIQMEAGHVPYEFLHRHAHNFYLNVLAEMGLMGFGATSLLLIQVFWLLWQRRWQLTSWTAVFFTPLIVFAIHDLFDTAWLRELVVATIFLAALIATLTPYPQKRAASSNRYPVATLWIAVWLFLVASGIVSWKMIKQYEEGVSMVMGGDWEGATAVFHVGQSLTPYDSSLFLFAAGFSDGVLAFEDEWYLPSAIDNQEQLILFEPGWSAHYANLAGLYRQANRKEEAAAVMKQAIELAPDVPVYYLNLGRWYEEDGEIETAVSIYRQLYQLSHVWHESPFWSTPIAMQAIDGLLLPPSPSQLKAVELQIAEDYDKAEKVFLEIAGYDALVNGNIDVASSIFQKLVVENPDGGEYYLGLGITHLYEDDIESAIAAFEQSAVWSSKSDNLMRTSLWQATLPTAMADDLSIAVTDLQYYYSIDGTKKFSGYYTLPVFEREPIPHDLLPQLSCFTFPSATGLHMELLQEWYLSQGNTTNANFIEDLFWGEGDGLATCLPPVHNVDANKQ